MKIFTRNNYTQENRYGNYLAGLYPKCTSQSLTKKIKYNKVIKLRCPILLHYIPPANLHAESLSPQVSDGGLPRFHCP